MKEITFWEASIKDIQVGENVKIVKPVNLYGCTLGDNCFVGPFVEIQKGVTIGEYTKIQSHTFICELVKIGKHCFVGHGVMFTNDLFKGGGPSRGDSSLWEHTLIGDNVSIGSGATILPVEICDGAVIGAGSVVTKDITKKGVYAGNPARLIREL